MWLDYTAEIFSVSTWGLGVDVILDCVGSSYWEKNLDCLRTDGRWIIYGLLSGGEVHGDLLARLLSKRASIHTTLLRSRDKEASDGSQQCLQRDLKISDNFEGFLFTPLQSRIYRIITKKAPPWTACLGKSLWNEVTVSLLCFYQMPPLTAAESGNDALDFLMCFVGTIS